MIPAMFGKQGNRGQHVHQNRIIDGPKLPQVGVAARSCFLTGIQKVGHVLRLACVVGGSLRQLRDRARLDDVDKRYKMQLRIKHAIFRSEAD